MISLVDDLRMRQLWPKTSDTYLRIVRECAQLLEGSHDASTIENLRSATSCISSVRRHRRFQKCPRHNHVEGCQHFQSDCAACTAAGRLDDYP